MIPNLIAHVESVRRKHPEAWRNAHTGNAHTEDFIRLLVADIRSVGTPENLRFALNGKRGNPNDISDDCLNFLGAGPGRTPDGQPCTVIDVIEKAGADHDHPNPNERPKPQWAPFSGAIESSGAHVIPAVEPEPVPVPVLDFPPRDLVADFFASLDEKYRRRGYPNRAVDGGWLHVDNEGLFVWLAEFIRRYVTGDHQVVTNDPAERALAAGIAVFDDIDAIWETQPPVERRVSDVSTLSAEEQESLKLIEQLGGVEERRSDEPHTPTEAEAADLGRPADTE